MTILRVDEIGEELADLVSRVKAGETILVEENGEPVLKIESVEKEQSDRRDRMFGALRGKIKIPEDFNEMMRDEIGEMFYGKP